MKSEKKLDKIGNLRNYAVIRAEEIKKLLNLLMFQDEEKEIKLIDIMIILENIMYRTKKLGKILHNMDKIIIK